MGDVSSKLMAQFADNLNQMIDDDSPAPADDEPAPAPAEVEPTPTTVRRIEGPATEPIDLMEVGGSSILKRVAPAIIAVVVLLFLLRRRRH